MSMTRSHFFIRDFMLSSDNRVQKCNGAETSTPIVGVNSYVFTIALMFNSDRSINITPSTQVKQGT